MEYRNHTWGPDSLLLTYAVTKDGSVTITDWKTQRGHPYRPTLDEQEHAPRDIKAYRREMLS